MRYIEQIYIIWFIIIYFPYSWFTIRSLAHILSKWLFLKTVFYFYSVLLILGLVFFYIWPLNPKQTLNYIPYFYFNTFLIFDILFKFPIFIAALIYRLFFVRIKKYTLLYMGLVVSIGIVSTLIYGTILGKKQFRIEQQVISFSNLPSGFNNFKILQFSDIHLGSFQNSKKIMVKTQKRIDEISPDIILFTGDLVNNFSSETKDWNVLFNKMNEKGRSYSILGNHDYGNYTRWKSSNERNLNFEGIIQAHKDLGFTLLRNSHIVIKSGNDSIYLVGVENWGHPPFPQYADIELAMEGIKDNSFKILMTHDPAHWESQIKEKLNINLTLSGHTHGLQWGLKFAGIPFSLSYNIRKNWGGLYQSGRQFLYVNTGIGIIGIPWRVDMPAELTVITLKRSEVD